MLLHILNTQFVLRQAFSGVNMLVGGWLDPACLLWMKKQPLCPRWLCFPLRMTQRSGLQRKLHSVHTKCPHRERKSPNIQYKSVKEFHHHLRRKSYLGACLTKLFTQFFVFLLLFLLSEVQFKKKPLWTIWINDLSTVKMFDLTGWSGWDFSEARDQNDEVFFFLHLHILVCKQWHWKAKVRQTRNTFFLFLHQFSCFFPTWSDHSTQVFS